MTAALPSALGLDPRQPHRAGGGVRAALEGVPVMEAGAREAALPAVAVRLRVDHLVRARVRVRVRVRVKVRVSAAARRSP